MQYLHPVRARGVLRCWVLVSLVSGQWATLMEPRPPPELKLLSVMGKLRAHQLGGRLRDRYGKELLSDDYEAGDCVAQSTEYVRARLSLQLVLAGLYVPHGPRRWHDSLDWQPIPFAYVPEIQDILLLPKKCPRFQRELARAKSTPEFQKLLDPYRDMLSDLAAWTGERMDSSFDMFKLYHRLAAMRSMMQPLPAWSKDIFPDGLLLNGTYLEYEILKYTDYMRKINGGALVRKILDDMLDKRIPVTKNSNGRKKLFLYSTHEMTIVALLQTLKIWNPHIPRYTSSILIELLEGSDGHFVKVLYYEGIPAKFQEMLIPGCPRTLCPLDRFIESISDQLPTHDQMICDDQASLVRRSSATRHAYQFNHP
ncbi:venom acid phosphatase Acph-1-like isoform X2 [Copidosoma floridanum]|uniref:venom acid phosphatase Acph-1-like isoform X2 n=1 Tax=Copidosoma floridanum TaxID=29053 RepID=UPI0006C96A75|nr:venom acid phosphatase Acph-1-like isoform X2 [Copidosoma floridanum]